MDVFQCCVFGIYGAILQQNQWCIFLFIADLTVASALTGFTGCTITLSPVDPSGTIITDGTSLTWAKGIAPDERIILGYRTDSQILSFQEEFSGDESRYDFDNETFNLIIHNAQESDQDSYTFTNNFGTYYVHTVNLSLLCGLTTDDLKGSLIYPNYEEFYVADENVQLTATFGPLVSDCEGTVAVTWKKDGTQMAMCTGYINESTECILANIPVDNPQVLDYTIEATIDCVTTGLLDVAVKIKGIQPPANETDSSRHLKLGLGVGIPCGCVVVCGLSIFAYIQLREKKEKPEKNKNKRRKSKGKAVEDRDPQNAVAET